MFWQLSSRAAHRQLCLCRDVSRIVARTSPSQFPLAPPTVRPFHAARALLAVKPVLLADIGEGIVECEVIQWFVEPGARVEEFSPLCEVQSDKASVEITSRFAGVVKRLHYEAGEMAKVGKPFVDIDIEGEVQGEDLNKLMPSEPVPTQETPRTEGQPSPVAQTIPPPPPPPQEQASPQGDGTAVQVEQKGRHATLATPATRHLSKELGVEISHVTGTGKDGRVTKEDIYKFVEKRDATPTQPAPSQATMAPGAAISLSSPDVTTIRPQQETKISMTRTQEMMFKTMTRSLSIPHFLYADEIDFTSLVELRSRLNKVLSKAGLSDGQVSKLSYLPFIIKAVSMALYKYPILNARVEADGSGNGNGNGNGKPALVLRSQHNIGVAMDTPQGLLVPVIKNVGSLNVLGIAAELGRLQALGAAGKLSPQDMAGGTITVSNIGSIGGTYLSPVVVEKEVAILGIGRMRTVPAFSTLPGEEDKVVKRQVCNFSWSADHRVVDGATLARAAEVVRTIVEEPDVMVMHLR
ncbi:hypothetical protein OQA88_6764 [Cercophora sp. LCS_1]